MKTVRILHTNGLGSFKETTWQKPNHTDDEIEVRAVMTGICRSDIDMMQGNFGPLPINMQGHEGLAQVTSVGRNIVDVRPGDYVATRGEPAFSDFYNVRQYEYVKVPTADPKYIVEPVACGINVVLHAMPMIRQKHHNARLLILGSGFLAWIAYQTLQIHSVECDIHVVGSSNRELWDKVCTLDSKPRGQYDVVIDLKTDLTVYHYDLLKPGAIWVVAAEKSTPITTDFNKFLWNANTIICPSPRTDHFYFTMDTAVRWINEGRINIDNFWSRGYDRNTEWQQAFTDGLNRPQGYSRGYLIWP